MAPGQDDAAEQLYEAYRTAPLGSDEEKEAIRALGECGGDRAIQLISHIYNNTPRGSVRELESIKALGRAGRLEQKVDIRPNNSDD